MNYFSMRSKNTIDKIKLDARYVEYLHEVSILHREESGISYKSFDRIAMLDWDWPNESHKLDRCVTIQSFEQVVEYLEPWLAKHSDQAVRLYETPGGVRGFFISKKQNVMEFLALGIDDLNSDPLYITLCTRRNAFGVRISPKLNRKADFVARYVCTLGHQQCPEVLDVIAKFHDRYLIN